MKMEHWLEKTLGTRVKNVELFKQALTHKSASEDNYETLEFVGDSFLGFIVTKYLYDKYKDENPDPGFLTRARTKIVRGSTLATIANNLGVGTYVQMDEKGMSRGWNFNSKILEDSLEAIIGALYLDQGMVAAKAFVLSLMEQIDWEALLIDDNYKDQLMRICQQCGELPEYVTTQIKETKEFSTYAKALGCVYPYAVGMSKKESEQKAALKALQNMMYNGSSSNCTQSDSQGVRGSKIRRMARTKKENSDSE